jgi:hypothetical protein
MSIEINSLEYSEIAAENLAVLHTDINDISVFIEDTAEGVEKIYLTIFKRLFKNTMRIEKIFQCNGRDGVVRQYDEYKNIEFKKLFIVDGDLEISKDTGNQDIDDKIIYILPMYCMENIFVCKNIIASILQTDCKNLPHDINEIVEETSLEEWIEKNTVHLTELFNHYATINLINKDIKTVRHNVLRILKQPETIDVCPMLLNNHIEKIKNEALQFTSEENYNLIYNGVKNTIATASIDKKYFISGKNYWLPMIKNFIRKYTKVVFDEYSFKNRSAHICNLDAFKDINTYIIN